MGPDTETHDCTMCRKWEALEHSVLNGMSSSNPSLRAQGTLWRRRQKDCKNQKGWMTPRKYCVPVTTGLTHMNSQRLLGTYIGSTEVQTRVPALRWERGQKLSLIDKQWQRKNSFSKSVSLSIHRTLKGGPKFRNRSSIQNKLKGILEILFFNS